MSAPTSRAAYLRTREVTERAAVGFGFVRGGGLTMGESQFRYAVARIAALAGVSHQTAKKHLERYIYNITPRKWGPQFREKETE